VSRPKPRSARSRAAEQHHIAGGALAALAERLGDVGDEELADVGAADDLGIGG